MKTSIRKERSFRLRIIITLFIAALFVVCGVTFSSSTEAHTVTTSGYVVSSDYLNNSFVVRTPDGNETYKVNSNTIYTKKDGTTASFQDVLTEGNFVIVSFSSTDARGDRTALAVTIASEG